MRSSGTSDVEGAPEEVEKAFDDIYPFNERFIHVAYRQLNDEGVTGRRRGSYSCGLSNTV